MRYKLGGSHTHTHTHARLIKRCVSKLLRGGIIKHDCVWHEPRIVRKERKDALCSSAVTKDQMVKVDVCADFLVRAVVCQRMCVSACMGKILIGNVADLLWHVSRQVLIRWQVGIVACLSLSFLHQYDTIRRA